jgi:hypothetical protein
MDDTAPATMNTEELSTTLSYDDTIPYEEQIAVDEPAGSSLANGIGKGKIYLLADARVHAKVCILSLFVYSPGPFKACVQTLFSFWAS